MATTTKPQDDQVSEAPVTSEDAAPTVDADAVAALVASVSEMLVMRLSDPAAYAAKLAAEQQVDDAYVAARPGRPLYDALVTLGIEGKPEVAVKRPNGTSSRGWSPLAATEWLMEQQAAGVTNSNKYDLIKAYRREGNVARDAEFFEIMDEVYS